MTRARDLADGKFATDVEVENSTAGAQNMVVIHHASNTSGDESKIQFKRTTDGGSDREVAAIVADRVGGNDTALVFETNTDGSDGATERARISHDGKFGVGTNSPQSVTHFKGTSSGENILHLDNSAGSAHGDTNNNVRVVSGDNGYWANLVVAGHQLEFKVQGGTSMLRVDSDGVKFNGSTASANALDDYEEGTWTAQMLGTASNPSATVTAATATYKKVGAIVWAGATFVGVNTTGASGSVVISGMPFNSDFTIPMGNVMSQNTFNVGSTVANITPYWANSTQVWFYHTLHGSNIWGAVQHSAGTSRYLYLSLIYTTAS